MKTYVCPVCDATLVCTRCRAMTYAPQALNALFAWIERYGRIEQRPKGLPGAFEVPCRTCGKELTCTRCQHAAWSPAVPPEAAEELKAIQARLWQQQPFTR
jgi:hypothetical protein